jgi:carbon monoxide dehydrogenase subunit G
MPAAERTISATARIAAPPEAVWALLSDPTRFADWADRTLEVTNARDNPLSLGSTYEERNVVLGPIKGQSRWTVVQHEAPHRQTHRGEGLPLTAALDFFVELRPLDGSTQLILGLRYRPSLGSLGSLLDRLWGRRSVQASMERSVRNVAALLEPQRASGS